jgi:hypothetical protein
MRITLGTQSTEQLAVYDEKGRNVTADFIDEEINIKIAGGVARLTVTGEKKSKPVKTIDVEG